MLKLANTVREEIAATKNLLDEIELRQSPSVYYDELLSFFQHMCDYTSALVETTEKFLANGAKLSKQDEELIRNVIVLSSSTVRQINSYCYYFEYADQLTVPNATIQLLHRLLGCISTHKAFIVRATTRYTYIYSPIGESLNRLASALNTYAITLAITLPVVIKPIDPSFAVVSLPLAINKSILANCNLIHEIGHLVVDSEGLQDKLWETLDTRKREEVSNIIERQARLGRQIDFDTAKRRKGIHKVLSNWIHETMADCLGLCLIGPAFLFAFVEFIEPIGVYQRDDEEHPCSSTRIGFMDTVVRKLGWEILIKEECPGISSRARGIGASGREAGPLAFNAAAECLPIVFPQIQKISEELCRSHLYRPESLLASKGSICGLLERGVPPAEEAGDGVGFTSFDVVSIINAGWIFRERGYPSWDSRFSRLSLVERGQLLNRLLAKALEVVFVSEAKGKMKARAK